MRATVYMAKLGALVAEHGDLECVDSNDTPIEDPEFSAGEGTQEPVLENAFVLAKTA